ncbi:hypothetical protein HHE06_15680 [Helicobacter heilmannii]|uniref:hypothetical protein n=1 Tax=Helicobacter heilmannii TaxID=35817 RepID=UPI0006A0A079|nr:hypothetical protein [Helicobacter heilmannii]CRF51675.1 hypothetical protein HHE06_15680 [Helicobacter heilmannii]
MGVWPTNVYGNEILKCKEYALQYIYSTTDAVFSPFSASYHKNGGLVASFQEQYKLLCLLHARHLLDEHSTNIPYTYEFLSTLKPF